MNDGRTRMELTPAPLLGRFVALEPLTPSVKAELRASLDVDPENWAIQYVNGRGEAFEVYWAQMLRQTDEGSRIPYGVRIADGTLVGTSSFHTMSPENGTVEIGSTFFRPQVRGTAVNPEAKLLMMGHAFGSGALRVQLTVDSRNQRSQRAVSKLGAVREGVLRSHLVTWTGHRRDTVVFSVIKEEWPQVQATLLDRLSKFKPGSPMGSDPA